MVNCDKTKCYAKVCMSVHFSIATLKGKIVMVYPEKQWLIRDYVSFADNPSLEILALERNDFYSGKPFNWPLLTRSQQNSKIFLFRVIYINRLALFYIIYKIIYLIQSSKNSIFECTDFCARKKVLRARLCTQNYVCIKQWQWALIYIVQLTIC